MSQILFIILVIIVAGILYNIFTHPIKYLILSIVVALAIVLLTHHSFIKIILTPFYFFLHLFGASMH